MSGVDNSTYDVLAREYDTKAALHEHSQAMVMRPFLDVLRDLFPSSPLRILDAGCAVGLDLQALAADDTLVIGMDVSAQMLAYARQRCASALLVRASVSSSLPFADGSFHGVVAHALIHLFEPQSAAAVLRRLLAATVRGGLATVTTTLEDRYQAGYETKSDYGLAPPRFRARYDRRAFAELCESFAESRDVNLVDLTYETNFGKRWQRATFQRSAG